jgi:alpha-tubulin suppressor-like RCC1 family protein
VACWGESSHINVRDPSITRSNTPVEVPSLRGVKALSGTCALRVHGSISCWGSNDYGQLGDGTHTSSRTPVAVRGSYESKGISAGGGHACAIAADGHVSCWGDNILGELGSGAENVPNGQTIGQTNWAVPVRVKGL